MVNPKKCLWLLCLILVSGRVLTACDDNDQKRDQPNIEPVATAVKTMLPLAYAVSQTMAAVTGSAVPGVTPSNTCASYPCLASATMTLDEGAVPVRLERYGEVYVAGLWSAADQAVMTVVFLGAKAGSGNYPVSKISTVPVSRTSDGITVVYASTDIDIASDPDDVVLDDQQLQDELARLQTSPSNDVEVAVALDAWVATVDYKGTPEDFTDDSYSLSGGGQYVGVGDHLAYVYQLGMVGTTMEPTCSLNPQQGYALINELEVRSGSQQDWPKIGAATLEFRSGCDGSARALLAVGSYGLIADKTIPLDLGLVAASRSSATASVPNAPSAPARPGPSAPPRP